jgi:hypothetical protein
MHSDWFNRIEILQGRWQHGEKVGYCYPNGFEKALCKWDIYAPLAMKGLTQATHQVKQMNENVLLWKTIQNNLLTTKKTCYNH